MTEYELFKSLIPHFPPREYALLPQVANGTGAGAKRHCDALALGLWPSRGLRLHGFEIKSYRGDWIRELRNPEKAEEIAQFCNHWWIVTAHVGMVKPDELPAGWGLMEYDSEKRALTKSRQAPFREASTPDMGFIAAAMRKAQEVVTPAAALAEASEEAFKRGKSEGEKLANWEAAEYRKLKAELVAFEKASGIKIDTWEGGKAVGEAVKQVLHGNIERERAALKRVCQQLLADLEAV